MAIENEEDMYSPLNRSIQELLRRDGHNADLVSVNNLNNKEELLNFLDNGGSVDLGFVASYFKREPMNIVKVKAFLPKWIALNDLFTSCLLTIAIEINQNRVLNSAGEGISFTYNGKWKKDEDGFRAEEYDLTNIDEEIQKRLNEVGHNMDLISIRKLNDKKQVLETLKSGINISLGFEGRRYHSKGEFEVTLESYLDGWKNLDNIMVGSLMIISRDIVNLGELNSAGSNIRFQYSNEWRKTKRVMPFYASE